MLDSIVTTQGMWSDTGFPRGSTIVFGYEVVQQDDEKNQSNCSAEDHPAYYSMYMLGLSQVIP